MISVNKCLGDAPQVHLYLVKNDCGYNFGKMLVCQCITQDDSTYVLWCKSDSFRKTHEDEHYAAAVFRYVREHAIQLKDQCTMVCINDEHWLKVGEPGFPVAAAERGRKVIVRAGTTFEVADHDFTKFSIVPSVAMIVDIPNDIHESWYRGQVMVGFKDAAFEASSPIRHATELSHVLSKNDELRKPVLFVYSDGGPDHRLTYALFNCL